MIEHNSHNFSAAGVYISQPTAPLAVIYKILTGLIIAVFLGGLIASLVYSPDFWAITGISAAVLTYGYLRTPIDYEIAAGTLTINFRLGSKSFENIEKCSLVKEKIDSGRRIWGNGGLFGVTGIFYSKKLKYYRLYISAYKPENLVNIMTDSKTIYISPQSPQTFVSVS